MDDNSIYTVIHASLENVLLENAVGLTEKIFGKGEIRFPEKNAFTYETDTVYFSVDDHNEYLYLSGKILKPINESLPFIISFSKLLDEESINFSLDYLEELNRNPVSEEFNIKKYP